MCHPQWQHSDDRQRFSLGAPEPRSRSSSQSIKRWVHLENACRRWAGLSIMLGATEDNRMTGDRCSDVQSILRHLPIILDRKSVVQGKSVSVRVALGGGRL